jgi:hypothetical protein
VVTDDFPRQLASTSISSNLLQHELAFLAGALGAARPDADLR